MPASATLSPAAAAAFGARVARNVDYATLATEYGFPTAAAARRAVFAFAVATQGSDDCLRSRPRRARNSAARTQRTARIEGLRTGIVESADRFGIEIECRRPRLWDHDGMALGTAQRASGDSTVQEAIAEILRNEAGVEVHAVGYDHNTVDYWKVCYDASSDMEIVSPPLPATEDGFAEVGRVMAALRNHGFRVGASEGQHVHVEMSTQDADTREAVYRTYVQNVATFDAFLPTSRRSYACMWARNPQNTEVDDNLALIRDEGGRTWDRYRTVNLQAFRRYGTFEFRAHGGTLNARKAQCWVALMVSLVAAARQGVRVDASTPSTLLSSLTAAGCLTADTAAWLAQRATALGCTTTVTDPLAALYTTTAGL